MTRREGGGDLAAATSRIASLVERRIDRLGARGRLGDGGVIHGSPDTPTKARAVARALVARACDSA